MFDDYIHVFIYVTVMASFISGLGNAAYYYFQISFAHKGIQGLPRGKRLVMAVFFGIASGLITSCVMFGSALFIYPIFKHQFLL